MSAAKPHFRPRSSAAQLAAGDGFETPTVGRSAHDGASTSANDMRTWLPMRRSADAEILPEWGQLVSRSRDSDRNNPIARGAKQTLVDNVVGTGPRMLAEPDYQLLGKDEDWALEWGETFERMFHAWWWSTAADAADKQTGDQIAQLVQAAQIMNADAFVLPLWLPERGDGYATKLQMVEADRVCNPDGKPDAQYLRGGIELDGYGMPLAAHVRRTHPGDFAISGVDSSIGQWERIPRRTSWGRLRWIHFYDQERAQQTRGKPLLTTILPLLKQVDRSVRAEIDAAVANALVAGIITTPLERDDIIELFSKDANAYLKAREEHAVRMQPGSLMSVFPGDDFKGFLPSRPNPQLAAFLKNILMFAAVGCDMPYELLVKDWSNTTYTSGRMALLEAWRSFNRRRDLLGTMFLDPIKALFLEEMVFAGRIEADGWDDPVRRQAYLCGSWIFPGRGWVDQVKEATGAQIRINSGLSTYAKECAEQGLYWRDVIRQRAVEMKFCQKMGVPYMVPTAHAPAPSAGGTTAEDGDPAEPGPNDKPRKKDDTATPAEDASYAAASNRMAFAEGVPA